MMKKLQHSTTKRQENINLKPLAVTMHLLRFAATQLLGQCGRSAAFMPDQLNSYGLGGLVLPMFLELGAWRLPEGWLLKLESLTGRFPLPLSLA
jgi:hypothetical protein